ncbi:MAG: hypothetical protein ORN98_02720 [Alphaproteobacteria bacterium]|nr:hypothetical protein [Alphaproteobacteria bacterium]
MSSYLRHSPNPRLTTLVGDRPPPRFAHLRSTLFALKAQANPNAGCKCQVGESS